MPTPDDTIRGLEERAFNAWPALQSVLVDGWVLRFADGYTKRANSVNALAPRTGIASISELAQPLFARAGLPLVVRLSPLVPDGSDAWLDQHGFHHRDETLVMTAPVAAARTPDRDVVISPVVEPQWSEGFALANAVPAARRHTHDAMLAAIRWPAAFASLTREGQTVAWGIAVAERGCVGLFDIVTAPAARRTGAGRRLVAALLGWGHGQGAASSYLQVVATNTPAIALYRGLGFEEAYRYHYRLQP